MDTTKGNIYQMLNGFKQFTIPVYQRKYSWEKEQCEKLWNDIVRMQKMNKSGHFVGSIVNIAEQAMPTGVQKYMIIDGQQRMTTLTLLLIALRNYALNHKEDLTVNSDMITEMCLKNNYQCEDLQYKIILTKTDKDILMSLIENKIISKGVCSRLIDNYKFFLEKIEKKELSPKEIFEAVGKLQIVNITLERQLDDPQLIFESLNSTGMALSHSDLIRNFILMGLCEQEQNNIYNTIWFQIEKLFDYENQMALMDKFFRDYLTMKLGRIPIISKVYDEFKLFYINGNFKSTEEFCFDIYRFATYYTNIIFSASENKELNIIFSNIKALQMEVSYPFLMKLYYDYDLGLISYDEFAEILNICESYVFRRAICGIATSSLNKTFATMKNNINEDDYLNSVKAAFILLGAYKIFPIDNVFHNEFIIRDIYNMRIRNYILSKLENYDNKSPVNINNLTIEHIMPQNENLSDEWKKELGEDWNLVYKTYLHTIGNLTLTAYNSEMSDKPFIEKLEMTGGFKQSALRINSFLVNQTTWNKAKIQERAEQLYNLAKLIWKYPVLSYEQLAPYIFSKKDSYLI